MISINSDENYSKLLEGVRIKTLIYGKETLLSKFILSKDAVLPDHNHPYEQTGYLISGKIILYIAGKRYEMNIGDSWCIPKDVPHKAEVIETSIILEVFSPPREDYKKFLDKDSILG